MWCNACALCYKMWKIIVLVIMLSISCPIIVFDIQVVQYNIIQSGLE